jgi:hypothetical protein
MEEPVNKRVLLLSALWSGAGQIAAGRAGRGAILLVVATVLQVFGGVTGTLLKALTGGRRPIKALPEKLNPLALVWLGVYLYNLYDAYNIASGADEADLDLLDYEEYSPEAPAADWAAGGASGPSAGASAPGVAPPPPPASPAAQTGAPSGAANGGGSGGASGVPTASEAAPPAGDEGIGDVRFDTTPGPFESMTSGALHASDQSSAETTTDGSSGAGPSKARVAEALADIAAADSAAVGGDVEDAGTVDLPGPGAGEMDMAGAPDGSGGAGAVAPPTPPIPRPARSAATAAGGDTTLDWAAGVTKARLLEVVGDDEQARNVYGQYLPAERVFHSSDEVDNLIPQQAWQDAQGQTWTGGDLPTTDEPSGYRDSAAGRMPPGDQTTGTLS